MKAREIITLCEDNILTGREFYEQLSSYFVKKMKSIDANETGDIEAIFNIGNDSSPEMKISRNYIKRLSKMIKGSAIIPKSTRLLIGCDGDGAWKDPLIFWSLDCFLPEDFTGNTVSLKINLWRDARNMIFNSKFTASETTLKNVCDKVDEVARAIRLVPFGG